ncbi:hypothetical protein [Stackebrandtia nassauensis]|uniref:hypothetical protein n=1 Tax=Stackebrandtia nassauensis TaxID=283811 RepID=UPI0001A392A8|nr:hypothetical protein [Stackebrandtia nassauensis]
MNEFDSVVVSPVVAGLAERVMRQHYSTADDWCGYCLSRRRVRVRWSFCEPYQRAAYIADSYRQQAAG